MTGLTPFCAQGPEDLESHADTILPEGRHMPQKLVQASPKHRGGVPLQGLEVFLAGQDGDEAVQCARLADLCEATRVQADGDQRVGHTAHCLT